MLDNNAKMLSEQLENKWGALLNEADTFGEISDSHRRHTTAVLLENQEQALKESSQHANVAGNVENWDPILMSLVRRSAPNLIAYDVAGVQPMTGPTGLVFALRSVYGDNASTAATAVANEAQFNEARTAFSGLATNGAITSADDASWVPDSGARATGISVGRGFALGTGEQLGADGGTDFQEMSFNIDKVTVQARTRALKAEYTMELSQDLKAIHGLDAENELANILSNEILAETNREVIRIIYNVAKAGAQNGETANAGRFDLDLDSNGRWSVERFKGLLFQIERDCNAIAKDTRRGKGNFILTSSDVASALAMAGVLDYAPALQSNLNVDDTGNTFAGTINGRLKVYVDPYFSQTAQRQFYCAGYKGASPMDAGIFYCPYVPLQMVRAVGEDTFQPKIGFKSRYGLVSNPFVTDGSNVPDEQRLLHNRNQYYRFTIVENLM